jgi:hypothetical protein
MTLAASSGVGTVISQIPADPFTNHADWKAVHKPSEGIGVFDVRSVSHATAVDGTPYSQW